MTLHPGDHVEPVQSAEVTSLKPYERENELDRLHADLTTKAHAAASRAEGIAIAANQTSASTAMAVGERVAVLEDHDRTTSSEFKQINARLGTIETAVKRSPYQQALYALTAVTVLLFYAGELIDKYFPSGGR